MCIDDLHGAGVLLIAAIASSLIGTPALATESDADRPVPAVAEITSRVLAAVNGYAALIGCEGGAEASGIAALAPYNYEADRSYPYATYAVVWHGDVGCMGGSGTVDARIAIVTLGIGSPYDFYIDPARSSPVIRFEPPVKYIERVVGNTGNSIVMDGRAYGPNDANCCPSQRIRFTMKVDAKGNWSLVRQKRIGVAPPESDAASSAPN
jgi:hypothetical protein